MPSNEERADVAEKTLAYYKLLKGQTGEPDGASIIDLLTDLHHNLAAADIDDPVEDMEEALEQAAMNFMTESNAETARCHRCGNHLDAYGFCSDETCPHSDWAQHVSYDDLTTMNKRDIVKKYGTMAVAVICTFRAQIGTAKRVDDNEGHPAHGRTWKVPMSMCMGIETHSEGSDELRYAETAPAIVQNYADCFEVEFDEDRVIDLTNEEA